MLALLPRQMCFAVLYQLGKVSKATFKEVFYSFLIKINVEQSVIEFWRQNSTKIEAWYLAQREENDLVISASPDFILEPICKQLGVRLIASQVDKVTGQLLSPNCKGEEKLVRFYREFPSDTIHQFYSDCESDIPLARIAVAAFIVNKTKIHPWPFPSNTKET